jgi:hypothetical protein
VTLIKTEGENQKWDDNDAATNSKKTGEKSGEKADEGED